MRPCSQNGRYNRSQTPSLHMTLGIKVRTVVQFDILLEGSSMISLSPADLNLLSLAHSFIRLLTLYLAWIYSMI